MTNLQNGTSPSNYDQEFSNSPEHSVVEMSDRQQGLGPGELRITGFNPQHLDSHFPESPRSSRLGSFMGNDPKFESPGASSASEELVDAPAAEAPCDGGLAQPADRESPLNLSNGKEPWGKTPGRSARPSRTILTNVSDLLFLLSMPSEAEPQKSAC